jgi:hypothetical protein
MSEFFKVPVEDSTISIIGHRNQNDEVLLFTREGKSNNINLICEHRQDYNTFIENIKMKNDHECEQCNTNIGGLFTTGTAGAIERFIDSTAKEIYNAVKNVRTNAGDYREVWEQTYHQVYEAVRQFQNGKEMKKASPDQQTNFRSFLLGVFTGGAKSTMNGLDFGSRIFAETEGPTDFKDNKRELVKFVYNYYKDQGNINSRFDRSSTKTIGVNFLKKYFSVGSAKSILEHLWKKFVTLKGNYYNFGMKIGSEYGKVVKVSGKGKVMEFGVLVKLSTFVAFADGVNTLFFKNNKGKMDLNAKEMFGDIESELK